MNRVGVLCSGGNSKEEEYHVKTWIIIHCKAVAIFLTYIGGKLQMSKEENGE